MKSITVILVIFFAAFAAAETNSLDSNLVEEPRFGFLDLNNNDATLTFNSTSLQYAVVAGIILLLVALVVVPLLGFDLGSLFAARGDGYDYSNNPYNPNQAYSSYSDYAKRSLDVLSPVLKALNDAYQKYE